MSAIQGSNIVVIDEEFVTDENTIVTGNLLSNDTDSDGDPLNITSINGLNLIPGMPISLASGAWLTVFGDGSFEYNPNGAFNSLANGENFVEAFTYEVSDGSAPTPVVTFNVVEQLSSLDGTNGFTISAPQNSGIQLGNSVSIVGDVNGDGIDDLIVGAPDGNGELGQSYLIFGTNTGFDPTFDLSTLNGGNGFSLSGFRNTGGSGAEVTGLGDVNGDGFDDFAIGAPGADADDRDAGEAYVVFGSNTGFQPDLNLSSLNGANGFQIFGAGRGDNLGVDISAAGDVNGDGFDDIILGTPLNDDNGQNSGQAYVIYGSAGGFSGGVDVSMLNGVDGFSIATGVNRDAVGESVSSAGDINGDGIDDFIVGATFADPNGSSSGEAHVVFGTTQGFGAFFDLQTLNGTNGFTINGSFAGQAIGREVSAAGDINGDGFDDLIVSSQGDDPLGRNNAGQSYVIFGSDQGFAADIDVASIDGTNGFTIAGANEGDLSGVSLAAAGDVNNDGIDDLLIGATQASASNPGAVHVLFGSTEGFPVQFDLATLDGTNGFTLEGTSISSLTGTTVSGGGDLNGDGIDDILIGAVGADSSDGAAHVVFGRNTVEIEPTEGTATITVNGVNDSPVLAIPLTDQFSPEDTTFSFVIPAGSFADVDGDALTLSATLADGSPLPAFVVFDTATGTFSGTPPQDFNGTLDITVTASDGALTASDTFAFNIIEVRETPVPVGSNVSLPFVFGSDVTVTQLDNGGYFIARTVDADVVAQLFDSNFNPIGNEFQVNTIDAGPGLGGDDSPSVTTLADGRVLVTWEGSETGTTPGQAIHARFYSENGEPLGDQFVAVPVDNNSQQRPIVDALADGGFIITYQNRAQDPDLFAQHFDVSGDAVGSRIAISSDSTLAHQSASTSLDSNGNLVVTWVTSDDLSSGVQTVFVRTFNSQGVALSPEIVVAETGIDAPAGRIDPAEVTFLNDGTFVIAFRSLAPDGDIDVFAQRYNLDGSTLGGPVTVSTTGIVGSLSQPAIAALPDGGYSVFWLISSDIIGQRFTADGERVGDEFTALEGVGGEPIAFVNDQEDLVVLNARGVQIFDIGARAADGINNAPIVLTPLADQSSPEDTAFSFVIPDDAFFDFDGDALTLSATLADGSPLPAFVVFDAATGTFSGTPPQDFNGALDITVTASDGALTASDTFALNITAVNDAPVVATPLADQSSPEDTAFSFVVPAGSFAEVDGDALTLSATLSDGSPLPAFVVFDAATGTFSGTPPQDFNGALDITVTASDGALTASDTFALNITAVNDAPVVATPLADQSSPEDTAFSFVVPVGSFADVDGDALTLSATLSDGSPLPAFVTFDAAAGTFSGTPSQDFNGALDITVTASDGALTASDTFALNITAVNDAPVVATPLADQSSPEDTAFSFLIADDSFLDFDGDALTLTATLADGSALPNFLVFDEVGGVFSGTPPQDFNGMFDITVTASDGVLSVNDTFALDITPVNDAPVLVTPLADQSSAEDGAFSFTIPAGSFADVDGNALTLSATLASGAPLPSFVNFNAATGTFSGTPPQNFNGSLNITVTASDGVLTASDTFALNITPVNDAPVLVTPLADQSSPEDEAFSFTIPAGSFADVDGNALTFSATLSNGAALPSYINFNSSTGTFSGAPPQDFNGVLDIRVTASDGSLSASDVFRLTITPVDEPEIIGGNGSDSINGTNGDDVILGLGGNDIINGLDGNDVLDGGVGDDTISGGNGDDIIIGGAGADILRGGSGADVFVYESFSDSGFPTIGNDVIVDFDGRFDQIDLSALNLNPGSVTINDGSEGEDFQIINVDDEDISFNIRIDNPISQVGFDDLIF